MIACYSNKTHIITQILARSDTDINARNEKGTATTSTNTTTTNITTTNTTTTTKGRVR